MKILGTLFWVALLVISFGKIAKADDQNILLSDSFLSSHPDMLYRLRGVKQYQNNNFSAAFKSFKRAARYADKSAQSMVAIMLWSGEGTRRDRALAYVWMDLAAERGYPRMLAFRKHYWAQLNEAERQHTTTLRPKVFEEFGDVIAQKRLETILRMETLSVTGSHVGYVGNVMVEIQSAHGSYEVPAAEYYQDKYWKPELYWQWQDQRWKDPEGTVTVGPLETQTPVKSP